MIIKSNSPRCLAACNEERSIGMTRVVYDETSNLELQTSNEGACQFFTLLVDGTIIEYQGLNP